MSDKPPFPLPGSPEAAEEFNTFMMHYGMALAAWAQLEESLNDNFQRLIAIAPTRARALFFSGRNFATRADLYSAALSTVTLPEIYGKAHRALLRKARQFSSARNSIAHGIPTRLFGDWPYQGLRIKHGQRTWESGGVGIDDLLSATSNFRQLKQASDQLAWSQKNEESAQRALELIAALPNEAFPREADLSLGEGE